MELMCAGRWLVFLRAWWSLLASIYDLGEPRRTPHQCDESSLSFRSGSLSHSCVDSSSCVLFVLNALWQGVADRTCLVCEGGLVAARSSIFHWRPPPRLLARFFLVDAGVGSRSRPLRAYIIICLIQEASRSHWQIRHKPRSHKCHTEIPL